MFKYIPTLLCDFYKISHKIQYPKNTTLVYSNLTPRNDKYFNGKSSFYDNKVMFFGLRYFLINLNDIFNNNFFNLPLEKVLHDYKRVIKYCLFVESPDISHIQELHELGYLPLHIKALSELSLVDYQIPVLTICNTLPQFFWLTNFIETWLSADLWLLSNNATIAYNYRKLCDNYANLTCDDNSHVDFQCHDFSFRGMGGKESALMSGMSHLTQFKGTDVIPAILGMEYYYDQNIENELIGCSIPASEHSVMCAGGKDTELVTYRRFINELYPEGLVSIVSDTWDFWKVLSDILPQLKDEIVARDGKVIIRPDSGDPVDIICGFEIFNYRYTIDIFKSFDRGFESYSLDKIRDVIYYNLFEEKYYSRCKTDNMDSVKNFCLLPSKMPINQIKGAIEILWDLFGGTINEKGYKVLDSHIGLIYGDSITIERAEEIFQRLEKKGFASSNITFGIGSYTYQYNTRDCQGWAVKATYCEVNNKGIEIYKDPLTDKGKKSAKGLLRVEKDNGKYILYDSQTREQEILGELKTVYIDGSIK